MALPKITQQRLFDWIEQCLAAGEPAPNDAEIARRFTGSVESARGLLADLADAGRITIKGHGAGRTVTIGRGAPARPPAPRPIRSVKKPQAADDDADAERILEIVRRKPAQPSPSQPETLAAAIGEQGLEAVIMPTPPHEETPVPALISSPPPPKPGPAPLALADIHLDALLDELRRRFEVVDQGRADAAAAAVARADAAEARLTQLRALLA